ncbi:MAG TPA: hypothetical protein VGX92_19020 [Pyrinomonadaceae bacterium]|jgi:hypothetical protein|nr:hypothetical protein [Pyrinomonadaceae bacterium]
MNLARRWRLGLLAGVAVMFLSLYPQLELWLKPDRSWNGAYAYYDIDEEAYSAYLNALIQGRPRRNDPYTGRDDTARAPLPESLFSIQFIPAYTVAVAARALGLSASSAFIALAFILPLASSLAVFWLLLTITGEERLAAVGVLVALCLGTLASAQGAAQALVGGEAAYIYLPFLRRYVPGVPFPLFFIFCCLIWRSFAAKERRIAHLSAILAGLVFGLLVFSYFYLWTAAAAWVVCVALLWLAARPEGWRRDAGSLLIVGGFATVALLLYAMMLSKRAPTMDAVQALTLSRAPDLFRTTELIGAGVFALLALCVRRGAARWRDRAVLFTMSLALVPFAVFNQQLLTGRSLQPFHYEQFIVSHVVLVALVLAVWLLRRRGREAIAATAAERRFPGVILIVTALVAFAWGVLEARVATGILADHNVFRDDAMPVARKLAELARGRGGVEGGGEREIVLSTHVVHADNLPTVAPQAMLWALHMRVFPGVTLAENKERFYQHLYYSGTDEKRFLEALGSYSFEYRIGLFAQERINRTLTTDLKPITAEEIQYELDLYLDYVESFDRERARRWPLSYVVAWARDNPDFTNLDRWYERDAGERIGNFILYRVKLRP